MKAAVLEGGRAFPQAPQVEGRTMVHNLSYTRQAGALGVHCTLPLRILREDLAVGFKHFRDQ